MAAPPPGWAPPPPGDGGGGYNGGGDVLVHSFPLDTNANQCGYPICCPGDQPKFVQPPIPPQQLDQCQINDELSQFFSESEEMFHSTGMPMFPCMLHHFCLPFSPICAMMYCANKRKERLDNLVKEFNKKATPKGLYLELNQDLLSGNWSSGGRGRHHVIVSCKPAIDLKMNVPKRQEYCGKNGILFAVPPIAQQPQQQPYYPAASAPYPPAVDHQPPPCYDHAVKRSHSSLSSHSDHFIDSGDSDGPAGGDYGGGGGGRVVEGDCGGGDGGGGGDGDCGGGDSGGGGDCGD